MLQSSSPKTRKIVRSHPIWQYIESLYNLYYNKYHKQAASLNRTSLKRSQFKNATNVSFFCDFSYSKSVRGHTLRVDPIDPPPTCPFATGLNADALLASVRHFLLTSNPKCNSRCLRNERDSPRSRFSASFVRVVQVNSLFRLVLKAYRFRPLDDSTYMYWQ